MATVTADLPFTQIGEPVISPADRLGMTLFFAVVAHLIVILGIVFVPDEPARELFSTLDVILVQHETKTEPQEAEYLAQASQDGGGESEAESRPASPMPTPLVSPEAVVTAAAPPVEAAQPAPAVQVPESEPVESVEPVSDQPVIAMVDPQAQMSVTDTSQPTPKPRRKPMTIPEVDPVTEVTDAQSVNAAALINRSLEMASLSAEIDQRLHAYAERPRRKWISARTREYKYASYMEAWRIKVERIGNLNYPDEARRKDLSGSLLLEVALNANGTINDIVLRRSSGHRVLDDAAIRIVKLAAPFAPLPTAILEDTDILHIERTWRFLNSSKFSG